MKWNGMCRGIFYNIIKYLSLNNFPISPSPLPCLPFLFPLFNLHERLGRVSINKEKGKEKVRVREKAGIWGSEGNIIKEWDEIPSIFFSPFHFVTNISGFLSLFYIIPYRPSLVSFHYTTYRPSRSILLHSFNFISLFNKIYPSLCLDYSSLVSLLYIIFLSLHSITYHYIKYRDETKNRLISTEES